MRLGLACRRIFIPDKASDVGKGCVRRSCSTSSCSFCDIPVCVDIDIDTDRISEPARELSDKATSPLGVVAIIITVGLLAPVAEELSFGVSYGSIRKKETLRKSNRRTSVIISSAIFSAIHFQLLLFPALFVVGMIFALIYERSKIGLSNLGTCRVQLRHCFHCLCD